MSAPDQNGAARPKAPKRTPATAGPTIRAKLPADWATPIVSPWCSRPAARERRLLIEGWVSPIPSARKAVPARSSPSVRLSGVTTRPMQIAARPPMSSRSSPNAPVPQFERSFKSLPIPGTKARSFFFGDGGTLLNKPPKVGGSDSFVWDKESRPADNFPGTNTSSGDLWTNHPSYDWKQPPAGNAASYISAPLAGDVGIVGSGAVNTWIRTSGTFDAVLDFDRAVRDPADPSRLLPGLHDGDWLHLNPEGYRILAAAVPARLLRHG